MRPGGKSHDDAWVGSDPRGAVPAFPGFAKPCAMAILPNGGLLNACPTLLYGRPDFLKQPCWSSIQNPGTLFSHTSLAPWAAGLQSHDADSVLLAPVLPRDPLPALTQGIHIHDLLTFCPALSRSVCPTTAVLRQRSLPASSRRSRSMQSWLAADPCCVCSHSHGDDLKRALGPLTAFSNAHLRQFDH